jgi:integrase
MARPALPLNRAGSISVAQVGPKRYRARCRYRTATGDRIQLERTGTSKTAAIRRLQEDLSNMRFEASNELRSTDTFDRAAQLWIRKFEALVSDGRRSATTLDLYRGQLDKVVLPALGNLRLAECTVGRMDMFFAGLASRRTRHGTLMSAKYRQSIRIVVKHVLQQAVKHGVLVANPIRDIDPIEDERRRKQPRALTPEERRRLFAWLAATDDDPAVAKAQAEARRMDLPDLITLMIGTGLRIGEAVGLRWRDVDLEGVPMTQADGSLTLQPILAVTGNIVRVKGQGLLRNAGKTEKALRIVPLPRFVADMLAARRTGDVEPDWPVFATIGTKNRGVTWRDPRNVSADLLAMRRAMGVDWKLTSHTFRRTAATIWHDSGTLSNRQSADLIGHSQITTMLNTYVARGELHPEGAAVMDAAWIDS